MIERTLFTVLWEEPVDEVHEVIGEVRSLPCALALLLLGSSRGALWLELLLLPETVAQFKNRDEQDEDEAPNDPIVLISDQITHAQEYQNKHPVSEAVSLTKFVAEIPRPLVGAFLFFIVEISQR